MMDGKKQFKNLRKLRLFPNRRSRALYQSTTSLTDISKALCNDCNRMENTMEEVLRYLQLKNQFYEQFLSISSKLLDKIRKNDWQELESIVDMRERIINIIHSFDAKTSQALAKIPEAIPNSMYKEQVTKVLNRRQHLANQIMSVDLELVSTIEDFRMETLKELKITNEKLNQTKAFEAIPNRHSTSSIKEV